MPLSFGQTFPEAIQASGLTPPDRITPGKVVRFPGFEKGPRNRSAWCILFTDERGGIFGDWSTGQQETWQANTYEERGPEWYEQIAEAQRLMRAERQAAQDEAAAEAAQLLAASLEPADDHPYLVAKGIPKSTALMTADGVLLIKMRDGSGATRNVQRIKPDGSKRFYPCAQVSGTYHAIKGIVPNAFVVCEGWATGVSINICTGYSVAVAFTRSNLENVVQYLRNAYPQADVIVAADDDWKTAGNPGLTDATRVAEQFGCRLVTPAFGEGRQDGDTDFNDMMRALGQEAVRQRFVLQQEQQDDDEARRWPDPSPPFEQHMLPRFPLDALPPELAEYARAESDASGFDVGGYAMAMLGVASALIDQRSKIRAGPMSVPAFLWVGLVAASGGGKSPVISAARGLIAKIDEDLTSSSSQRMRDYESHMQSLSRDERKSAAMDKPRWHQRIATDTTVEALGDLLRDNPHGMLMIQDEITEFIGRMDAYGNGVGGKDRGAYLRAFDGGSIVINRKTGAAPTKIDNFSVSLLAGIQPEKLAELFHKQGGGSDGLYQRFLVYCMGTPAGLNYGDNTPSVLKQAAQGLMEKLHIWTFHERFRDAELSRDVLMEAQEFHLCMRNLAIRTPAKRFAEHLGKFPGFVMRIAFTLHCIDCVRQDRWSDTVSADAFRRARQIMAVLYRHSEAVYQTLDDGAKEVNELAQSAANVILVKGWKSFMRGDLTRHAAGWRAAKDNAAEGALDLLIELDWIRDETPPALPGKRGRKSGGVFKVNPRVHQVFVKRAEAEREARRLRRQVLERNLLLHRGQEHAKDASV